jgi:hypothetical protein
MKDFIPIISLLIAFLAVIVGPFICWMIAKKQAEVSIRMARRNTIAPMRQQWINDLRTRIIEQDHKQLLEHLKKITFGMNRKEMILKYESNMVRTTQLAQKIFKDEWIRVKEEF